MKIDLKVGIIIILVGVIGYLFGSRNNSQIIPQQVSQTTTSTSTKSFIPADDGKLAKEYKKNELMKIIRTNAKDIQTCYLDLLSSKPKVSEGILSLLFKVEEDGKISSAKITANEFKNEKFGGCVSGKMSSYYLAPPPYGINRFISHDLAFKSEETAKREAKERAEKNKPPKVLPVR